jgi:hypothetical protein
MQFMMIAKAPQGTQMEQILPYIKPEAAKTWEFYSSGLIRSMSYIADMSGVIFLWEAPSLEAVNEAIAQLPMKKDGILNFEVIPLAQYTGIQELFAK